VAHGIGSSFPAGVRTNANGVTVQVGAGGVAVGVPGDGLVTVAGGADAFVRGGVIVDALAVGPSVQLGRDLGELGVDRTVNAAGSVGHFRGLHVLGACQEILSFYCNS
jgi:hypothetical protein